MKFNQYSIIVWLLFITTVALGQEQQKVFIDSNYKKVRNQSKATFYEIREGQGARNSFIGKISLYTLEDKLVHYEFLNKGTRDGTYASFDPKSGAKTIGNYITGKRTGTWYKTDVAGNIIGSFEYTEEDKVTNEVDLDKNNDTYYVLTDLPAEYAEGNAAWGSYLRKSIRYPREVASKGLGGRIEVHFLISKTGDILDNYTVQSPHPSITEQILKVITESGEWRAAIKNGTPVNSILIYKSTYNFIDLRN